MAESCGKALSSDKAFGPAARLRCRAHLDAVRANGMNLAGRYSVIVVLKTPPEMDRRTAFLISRRFDLNAVVRNRARRLLRECWRQLFPNLAPCWVLMIPRKGIKNAKLGDVFPEIRKNLLKAGVLVSLDDDEKSTPS
ncbi:MAG: ribonuclease P protein component [Lentisphaeria bacterium]|nr:ribonuclease P protein component [Lentisphaeria bacterium]